ncbi:hypothetical protein NEF87_001592 [Candidatus Lokiarchaeum ossiferum]|uniref:DUF5655 domain-containing protein n=1 Tax=Candidatus Lokiarchaeum ossiferum TaxID=2951803 RepID=A0ABY6HSE0_9ARCH|nr:hypothetical protein NEF87_001592 [Candidatus Lokiarchaeum sp. B-35]
MPKMHKSLWICPNCRRTFTRKNQSHSCELYSIEDHHLNNIPVETARLFRDFVSQVQKFGPISVESLKNIIALKKQSQFCSIKIQKKALKIIFRLFTQLFSSRFTASSHQKDGRFYYQLSIRSQKELDAEFLEWMQLAYDEN